MLSADDTMVEILIQVRDAVQRQGLHYGNYWPGADISSMTDVYAAAQTLDEDIPCCLIGYFLRHCATYAQYKEADRLIASCMCGITPEQYSDRGKSAAVLTLLDRIIDNNSREGAAP